MFGLACASAVVNFQIHCRCLILIFCQIQQGKSLIELWIGYRFLFVILVDRGRNGDFRGVRFQLRGEDGARVDRLHHGQTAILVLGTELEVVLTVLLIRGGHSWEQLVTRIRRHGLRTKEMWAFRTVHFLERGIEDCVVISCRIVESITCLINFWV